jgi:hypothetical protein
MDKLIVNFAGFGITAEGAVAIGAAVLIVLIAALASRWRRRR